MVDGVRGLMEVEAGRAGRSKECADAGSTSAQQLIAEKNRCHPINKGLGAAPHTLLAALSQD
jgi:hypothetical protein